jgi:hypothetical protein
LPAAIDAYGLEALEHLRFAMPKKLDGAGIAAFFEG